MAEAFVAVGSVAAILQLADYSKRFLKLLKEYQAKSTSLPLSFQTILSQQNLLIRSLDLLEARAQQNQIDEDSIPHIRILSDACRQEMEYLDGVLNRIAASGTTFRARKAMKAIRHEKDIERSAAMLKDRLNTLFTFYQINSIPLRQVHPSGESGDNDARESLVTVGRPAEAVQEIQTALLPEQGKEQHVFQQATQIAQRCKCRRREVVKSLKSWILGPASASYDVLTEHRSGCPLYARSVKQQRISFSLQYTSVILRIIAGVTMTMKYGAGGLSLSPNLTLRGMMREGSPAFRLFHYYEWEVCRTGADVIAKINQVSLRLQQMFDERIASPFDLDRKGNSLLFVAYAPIFRIYKPTWHCHDLIEKRLGLLTLFRNLGVPLNATSRRNVYDYDYDYDYNYVQEMGAEYNPELVAFMMTLDTGIVSSSRSRIRDLQRQAFMCARHFPDYAEMLDCNALQLAILQRNESLVEDIIRVDASAVHFQNGVGQTPLHVAADWPWATALLLTNGADLHQVDYDHSTAIDLACNLHSCEVVTALLEAGSPMLAYGALSEVVRCHTGYFCEKLFKLLISHLAIRRRELLRLARNLLPEATLSSIILPKEAIPDSSSFKLIQAVYAAGDDTKPDYWFRRLQGLYQGRKMLPAAADILYEAGFDHLEGRDYWGETPLSSTLTSAMIVWLYRKGVSFTEWTEVDRFGEYSLRIPAMYPAIHGAVDSMYSFDYSHGLGQLKCSDSDIEALNICLQDDFSGLRDMCHCACCSGGCSPEVIVLKTVLRGLELDHRPWPWIPEVLLSFSKLIDAMIAQFYGRLVPSISMRLYQAAIRMALFVDLGLRHICCRMHPSYEKGLYAPISQEEADEIREEDRFLAQKFEALLPKAQSEWQKSEKGLADFWRDFHKANICRQRDGRLDETELATWRELGVVVLKRGDEAVDCDSLYGDEEGYCKSLCSDDGSAGEEEDVGCAEQDEE